jgi:murein DD-endopeptidase MepM/ murein hydrolase activator NlpD
MLTQTPEVADNSRQSGHHCRHAGIAISGDPALAAAYRITRDYKVVEFNDNRAVRRAPWFIAGLGIPLLCLGFIAPKKDAPSPESVSVRTSEIALPEDTTAPAAELDATGESAPKGVDARVENVASSQDVQGEDVILEVRRGDSLDRMFRRNDLKAGDLAEIMTLDVARQHLRLIKPGDKIAVRKRADEVLTLSKHVSLTETLNIQRVGTSFEAEMIERKLDTHVVYTAGKINSSLFEAAAEAGITDRTIMNLAGIFAWDVDFMLDIREGDQFTLIYEELWQGGKRLADGKILAAEFVNQGESFRAVRYEDSSGRIDYFSPDGRSVRKAFVRAPLSFSRVSSNFNPKRRHPKLNTIRAHHGVDYAAPSGTPIKAAGDGKIIHRGKKGGYGNVIILQHGGNITTLYAHLSRFSKAKSGSRVRQGDIIGYVGATGLATGPHLHYEYRRNGVHLNPRTVKLPDAKPIDPAYLADFSQAAQPLLQQLDDPRSSLVADTRNTIL